MTGPATTRFALTLEFDGTPFMGLQRQDHGKTVQGTVEDAVFAVTGEKVRMMSAGRTDSGVHALAMRAHIDVAKDITPFRLMEGINARMRPAPVAVIACETVPDEWHARFSCTGRKYLYRIVNRRAPLALDPLRAWQVTRPLNVEAMHEAAQVLVGRHDFTTFRSVNCQSRSPVKGLDVLDVSGEGERVEVRAEALSFLHHQVRSMVGSLALVGTGKWTARDLRNALEARDRQALGLNAPPHGLYFVEAVYP